MSLGASSLPRHIIPPSFARYASFFRADCCTSIRSVWALRAGVALAFLPVLGFLASIAYGYVLTRHARLFPEDYWPVLGAIVFCLGFAGVCLLPGLVLLSFHVRRSRMARWALVFSSIEALAVLGFIVYVNRAA